MASNSAPIIPAAPHLHRLRGRLLLPHARRGAGQRVVVVVRAVSGDGGRGGGPSYLDMWKKAVDRERRSAELAYRLQASPPPAEAPHQADVERRTARFEEMLRVPREERDRVQRTQVIDRAAAALAAARAVLKEPPQSSPTPQPQKPAAATGVTGSGDVFGSRKAAKGPEDQGSGQRSVPAASQSAKGTTTRR
uniref:Uncharacterized protein n=1 Tax=Aegilops tauschii subsp. strangulata TaxID=200361 RepID=A0A453I145_AEGTS